MKSYIDSEGIFGIYRVGLVNKEHNGLGLQLQKFASFTGLKINHDHNWWVIIGTLGGNYDDIKLALGPKLGWVYY